MRRSNKVDRKIRSIFYYGNWLPTRSFVFLQILNCALKDPTKINEQQFGLVDLVKFRSKLSKGAIKLGLIRSLYNQTNLFVTYRPDLNEPYLDYFQT